MDGWARWHDAQKDHPPRAGVYLVWYQQEKSRFWKIGTFGVGLYGGGRLWTLGGIFPTGTVDAETTKFYWTEPPITPPEQEAREAVRRFCACQRKGGYCPAERCPLYKLHEGKEMCSDAALKHWDEARDIVCYER